MKNRANEIVMIAAAGENNALGKDNLLLWHLPNDFKRFKKLTSGHKIIMGRKTFETFARPLPNRVHIIITRDKNYRVDHPECLVVHSLKSAMKLVAKDPIAYIIGGGEIYRQGEVHATKIELTRVHANFDADTFFIAIDNNKWKLANTEFHPKDDQHAYDFSFLTYVRK